LSSNEVDCHQYQSDQLTCKDCEIEKNTDLQIAQAFVPAKILLLDIECSPNKGRFFGKHWKTNILEVTKDERIISVAWKWEGIEKKVSVKALPDYDLYLTEPDNDEELVRKIWQPINEADIIVVHNVAYDYKKILSKFAVHSLPAPKPTIQYCTLRASRRVFGFSSHKLSELARQLSLGSKLETGGYELWSQCLRGSKSAWRRMKKYPDLISSIAGMSVRVVARRKFRREDGGELGRLSADNIGVLPVAIGSLARYPKRLGLSLELGGMHIW
jgi:hypothetical protein